MVIHPGDDAAAVIRHWRDYMDQAPDGIRSMLLVMRAAAPLFPPEYDGKPVVGFLVVHADGGEQAERDLRPLRVGDSDRRWRGADPIRRDSAGAGAGLAAEEAVL